MSENKTCNCWDEKDSKLREMGYKISDSCAMLQIKDLNLTAKFGLPLQRINGGKLKRDDPQMITISHCPFCGVALMPNDPKLSHDGIADGSPNHNRTNSKSGSSLAPARC
jgi:hypothetical protein